MENNLPEKENTQTSWGSWLYRQAAFFIRTQTVKTTSSFYVPTFSKEETDILLKDIATEHTSPYINGVGHNVQESYMFCNFKNENIKTAFVNGLKEHFDITLGHVNIRNHAFTDNSTLTVSFEPSSSRTGEIILLNLLIDKGAGYLKCYLPPEQVPIESRPVQQTQPQVNYVALVQQQNVNSQNQLLSSFQNL